MASKKVSPTLKVLQEIRAEIRANTEEIRANTEEIRATGRRVDGLQARVVEGQVRVATELAGVADAVVSVRELLLHRLDDRDRIDDHEKRLRLLEDKAF